MIIITLVALVMLVGLLIYILAPPDSPKLTMIGLIMFRYGLLVLLLSSSTVVGFFTRR